MRRWNGWGDTSVDYPLPAAAEGYLATRVGPAQRLPDASFETTLAGVPRSRLPAHDLISLDPAERLLHARGQSLPDWIALRAGRAGPFPDGVAQPATAAEVRALLTYAARQGVRVIPYGGGTSVVGHINPIAGPQPVLTIDMGRLNRLVGLDETSRLATFEAGITGPAIERALGDRGVTLGHYPQSFECSTLGGWVATRSSGQQSYFYGRIEDLLAGAQVETPRGPWRLPPLPATAAGPDLRQVLLGSEGRLGIITQATVRIRPRPRQERFEGVFFREWEAGVAAVRAIAQAGRRVSMLRLSDAAETETTLRLAGHGRLVGWAERGLGALGFGAGRCLLLLGSTVEPGSPSGRGAALQAARGFGGLPAGAYVGQVWAKSRFRAPYLRNTLWERGYALDTLETALPWSRVMEARERITAALRSGLEACGERVLVLAHLSHVYADGASLYITYLFRRAPDPDETLRRWQVLKAAASRLVVECGGTISHQHGVGADHAAYLAAEKGAPGMQLLRAAITALDPQGVCNPGKLLPEVGDGHVG